MTGNVSMIFSLSNLWRAWYQFRRGKKPSLAIDAFELQLEPNLYALYHEIQTGTYVHGAYRTMVVSDRKRRTISIASIRDRVVHRLLYEYAVKIFDRLFIYDAWSCRKGKGLIGAIERAQQFCRRYPTGFVWQADIRKFFDSVRHDVLRASIQRRVKDQQALTLINTVIGSYCLRCRGFEERERV